MTRGSKGSNAIFDQPFRICLWYRDGNLEREVGQLANFSVAKAAFDEAVAAYPSSHEITLANGIRTMLKSTKGVDRP